MHAAARRRPARPARPARTVAGPPGTTEATGPGPGPDRRGHERSRHPRHHTGSTGGTERGGADPRGRRTAGEALPIPDYDELSASHVVGRLDGLTDDDLETVRAYESAHRNRRTILGKIAQLRQ